MTTIRTGFLQVPNVFFETCDLLESAQILFLRLAAYQGKHHLPAITGSERQIANLVRMSRSTVKRMLDVLIDAEYITVTLSEGLESAREVMSIEVNMDRLWELNAPTDPNWTNKPNDRSNLDQTGPNKTTMVQKGESTVQNDISMVHPQAQSRDNTIKTINTLRQRKTGDASLSFSEKKSLEEKDDFSLVPAGFLKPELRAAR